ncbi:response regulator [Pseudobdellovibrio exovorus]|uniref:Putative response regulator n=1 Tax=Pseudobdellovibrio exovorus JSS TaxID=1184267 RepID=M4VAN6_9BACT|nr:response regulator [Pseudobdellovibrio exovorus]AGH96293.1 putative response regulator [Pseudobdellovibrio exovorus JSS]
MKFLIVDDEALIRKSLVRAFAAAGFQCDEAENGKQALEKINTNNYRAVLLDVIMPEKNGYEVLLEMKKNTPVFVISAFTGDDTNIGFIQKDPRVIEYLTKPFEDIFAIVKLVVSKT